MVTKKALGEKGGGGGGGGSSSVVGGEDDMVDAIAISELEVQVEEAGVEAERVFSTQQRQDTTHLTRLTSAISLKEQLAAELRRTAHQFEVGFRFVIGL